MKIKVTPHTTRNGKKRILFTLTAGSDALEQKVMRSIASANFGEKIFIRNRPLIEVKIEVPNARKVQRRIYPDSNAAPEVMASASKPRIIDKEEYDAATRTIRAHALLRSLGGHIPESIAKKFYCRCGLEFVMPIDFLNHRQVCPVLHTEDAELLARGEVLLAKQAAIDKAKEPIAKTKETFECRCGHIFTKKTVYRKHQLRCQVIKEDEDVFVQGKAYLEKEKERNNALKASKKQGKKKRKLDNGIRDTSAKRKRRGSKNA